MSMSCAGGRPKPNCRCIDTAKSNGTGPTRDVIQEIARSQLINLDAATVRKMTISERMACSSDQGVESKTLVDEGPWPREATLGARYQSCSGEGGDALVNCHSATRVLANLQVRRPRQAPGGLLWHTLRILHLLHLRQQAAASCVNTKCGSKLLRGARGVVQRCWATENCRSHRRQVAAHGCFLIAGQTCDAVGKACEGVGEELGIRL
mmetsp:Transcript_17031/g.44841  ORF Transcript_17031/g.44841 Transcript_17031/m.44841 type:complete len:208 (-) Transcript_17031:512-1135(-)